MIDLEVQGPALRVFHAWPLGVPCSSRGGGAFGVCVRNRGAAARNQSRQPGISSFTVGEVDLSDAITVPATIHYDNQTVITVHYLMEQDSRTGGIEVCTEED